MQKSYVWFIQVNHFYMHNVQVTIFYFFYNLAYTNLLVLCTQFFAIGPRTLVFSPQIKGFSYFLNFLKKIMNNFITSSNSWTKCGYG